MDEKMIQRIKKLQALHRGTGRDRESMQQLFIYSGQHGAYQRQHAYAAYGNGYTEGISDAGEVRAAHGRIQRGSKRVLPSIQTITEKAQLAYAQQI